MALRGARLGFAGASEDASLAASALAVALAAALAPALAAAPVLASAAVLTDGWVSFIRDQDVEGWNAGTAAC